MVAKDWDCFAQAVVVVESVAYYEVARNQHCLYQIVAVVVVVVELLAELQGKGFGWLLCTMLATNH